MREQTIYELLETDYPQVTPFVASYLGVVNVTFRSTTNPNQGVSFSDTAPVVMLEQNKHLLSNAEIPHIEKSGSYDSRNEKQKFYSEIQQKIFKEAISPKSMTARFARLKELNNVTPSRAQSHHYVKKDISPSQCSPAGSQSELPAQPPLDFNPIFHMSEEEKDPHTETPEKKTENYNNPISGQFFEATGSGSFNPWSIHLYNTRMAKFNSESVKYNSLRGERTQKFILMEDLTQNLNYPCILDLKMGTRQHGVNATYDKKISQERKCERSTSRKLGVRICGMQVIMQI